MKKITTIYLDDDVIQKINVLRTNYFSFSQITNFLLRFVIDDKERRNEFINSLFNKKIN